MCFRPPRPQRRGAILAEAAVVLPVMFLLILGLAIGGMGVFRYQQVAAVAREGSRWAAVHGGQYATDTGHAMATPQSVYSNAIQPMAIGLDKSHLAYTVTWNDAGEMPTYKDGSGNKLVNKVTVTVTYTWIPEAFLSPVTFKSTSVMPVAY
jgi:Flp pilus assembly protein TadG